MHKQKIQFSIVIPTFNPDFKIFETLQSIKKSILDFSNNNEIEYEIIIINDGGKKLNNEIQNIVKNINIFNLKKNKGVGYAREIGSRIAKHEIIFYIDSDIIIEPNTLSVLYKEHQNLEDAGSVGALQSYNNLNSTYSSKFVCAKSCYGFEDKPEISEFSAIHSECCIINKNYLREIGGWNFYEKSGGEEFELGHKIILSGKKNYLTKKTRYSTYYENILNRCDKVIYRTSNYLPIFFSRKKFETKGAFATKEQFLSVLLTLTTALCLFTFFFTKTSFVYLLPIILLNLIIEFDFLKFSKQIFSIKDIPFFIIGIYIINMAIFIGFIFGIFNLIKKKNMKKFLIIVPTLNESGNVTIIFKQIKKFQKKSDILFIDDNSIDGTKKEILHLKKISKKVFYLFRKNKKGIGSAHKDGIIWAYKKKYGYICTMDCDGAHHPKDISKMLKKIKYCDIVSTNRFLKKNSLVNWSIGRIFVTKLRFFLVQFMLGTKLDSSGAFRLYDSKKINIKDILYAKDTHYNFFWESFFFLEKKYLIKEISVTLPVRSLGKSKMNFKDIIYGFFYLIKTHLKYFYKKQIN